MTNDVLLTVSGQIDPNISEKIARRERPQADYIEMARVFSADLIDYNLARKQLGWMGKILEKIGGANMLLAWACYKLRKKYRVIFTDGEQIGIPLAFTLKYFCWGKRPSHLMIGHILSVGKKTIFMDWLGLQSHIDLFFVYATWQKRFIENRWDVSPARVIFTPFMVDTNFFVPDQARKGERLIEFDDRQVICSVGLEFRDYPTLIEAVKDLDVQVVIAAASPWSKRSDTTADQDIPNNVLVRRFTQFELRDLYAMSEFMVMPLFKVNFQAGVTALLEAMAMEKAVICTLTPGQTDVVVEGETGLYVPPNDAHALRQAIVQLLNNPHEAKRMGKNGRKRIGESMSLVRYVDRLNKFVNPKDKNS